METLSYEDGLEFELIFESIVESYQPRLIGFFHKHVRDRQIAEDLAQETLIRVYRGNYVEQGGFTAWVYRIARHVMVDHLRRQKNDVLSNAIAVQKHGFEEDFEETADYNEQIANLDQLIDSRAISACVEECLDELPESQRHAFVMFTYSGLSFPEIADATECCLATAKAE